MESPKIGLQHSRPYKVIVRGKRNKFLVIENTVVSNLTGSLDLYYGNSHLGLNSAH